ncbi:glucosaminidase domain-containing protein [Holzapfeliella sp. He02]|uniref:Glucosaminidase domain-containing protein n=1 Tax=Holzapfeliella saturejae TaxID=3082953 RepID=A0ABU8SF51_9LACO
MSKKFLTTTLAAATVLSVSALPASHLLSQQASGNTVQAATDDNSQFIERIAPYAQAQAMNYGVYPSVMMAQAILESAWGTSALGQAPNYNLFGIKGAYQGQSVMMPTSEWDSNAGKYIQIQAPFRKYPDFGASFGDNGDKLRNGLTTNSNFYNGTWIENTTSYQDSTKWLTGRYATSPTYNTNLNRVIETYNLTRFDPQVTTVNGQVQTKTTANLYNTYTGVKTKSNTATAGQVFSINQKVVLPDNSIYYRLTNNLWVSDKDVTSNISQGPINNNQNTQPTTDKAQSFAPFSKGAQLNSNVSGYQLSSDNTFSASKQLTSQHVQLTTKATTTQGIVYYLSSTNGVWIKASDLTLDKDQASQAPENPVNKTSMESKDVRMQDNYNIYSLSGNTFSLSTNTNNFSDKYVKAIEKATQGNRTYYLLSDGQKQLGWIDQIGVIDEVKVVEDFYKQQPIKKSDNLDVPVYIRLLADDVIFQIKDDQFVESRKAGDLANNTNLRMIQVAAKGENEFYLISDGEKDLGYIGQSAMGHLFNIPKAQDVTPQKVSVNTNVQHYYLTDAGFSKANEKLSSSMMVIKKATSGYKEYSLLSNDGKTPVAWVQSSDVKAANTNTQQPTDNKVTTQDVTPQKVIINAGAANYYLMNNGFVNAGEKLPSSMTVIKTATKGSTQYSLVSTDGKTPFAWVQSSDVKAVNNVQQSTDNNKVTTQDVTPKSVKVASGYNTYYLLSSGFSRFGNTSDMNVQGSTDTKVIQTATQNNKSYSLLSLDGKTPFAWVSSEAVEDGVLYASTNNNPIGLSDVSKSATVVNGGNAYYLTSVGNGDTLNLISAGKSDDYAGTVKVIKQATQNGKKYYLISKDGQSGLAWIDEAGLYLGNTQQSSNQNTQAQTSSMQTLNGTATINYVPGYSIRVWTDSLQPTENYLKHDTAWRVFGKKVMGNKTYYQVGLNQWIDSQYAKIS